MGRYRNQNYRQTIVIPTDVRPPSDIGDLATGGKPFTIQMGASPSPLRPEGRNGCMWWESSSVSG
jgi:hypothetical protein